jgi:biotin carboxylase
VEAARRLGIDLTVASEQPSAFQDANPAGLVTLDLLHVDRAVEQARAFAQAHPLQGVVGVDDDTAVVAAAIAGELGLRGNASAAARAARDKHEQRTLLAAARVPVPRFVLHRLDQDPSRLAERTAFPCVVKPLRLSASRGVIRADTPAQLVAACERVRRILAEPDAAPCGEPARSVLVEDFIPGSEHALEGLLGGGERCSTSQIRSTVRTSKSRSTSRPPAWRRALRMRSRRAPSAPPPRSASPRDRCTRSCAGTNGGPG